MADIAAGTSHKSLRQRMGVVVEDGNRVREAIANRGREQIRLDTIEVEQKLRAQREAEEREKLGRATK